jgi:methylated-DNA-[protein]-cysteine S-methyltransferase
MAKTMAHDRSASIADAIAYCLFDTAFGVCGIAWTQAGLIRVQLPERDAALTEKRLRAKASSRVQQNPPPPIAACITQLQHYFSGAPVDFREAPLDFSGVSAFNADVYRALRDIGWRQTTTYGALARQVGNPRAAQAVGVAMATNPWPVIVPCHRVLAAGRLGGFTAPGGAATKLKLLRMEGAAIDSGMPLFGDYAV